MISVVKCKNGIIRVVMDLTQEELEMFQVAILDEERYGNYNIDHIVNDLSKALRDKKIKSAY